MSQHNIPENTDSPNALKLFAQQTGPVKAAPLKGTHTVLFDITGLTTQELGVCVALKALLCDPDLEHLRWALNHGASVALRDGKVFVLPKSFPAPCQLPGGNVSLN